MSKKYTDEEIIYLFKGLCEKIGRTPTKNDIALEKQENKRFPSDKTLERVFGSLGKLAIHCGYKPNGGSKSNKEFLISELQRFNKEFGRIPTQQDFNVKNKNYPTRKTFTNHFGKFNEALRAAGFIIQDRPEYTKEYLLLEIKRFMLEFSKQPNAHEMDSIKGYPSKRNYTKVFGTWNNALKELGLKVRSSHYSDEELKDAFDSFVEIHGRPPTSYEFNDNDNYPSFWCYQNRFGSWNKAVTTYGYNVNDGASGTHYELKNGEVCKSTYEYDVSLWLRKNRVSYLRNLPYRDLLEWYDGRKDCDYVILHNGEFIFLEVAGLYSHREKKSNMEKDYIQRFDHKVENLLSQFNYKILYPNDFKERTLDEMFSFLFDIPRPEWLTYEEIYQGI